MAYSTRLQLRTRLNAALGVEDGSDKPFGSAALRDAALRDGFERLYPQMRRLREQSAVAVTPTVQVYDLTDIRDCHLIEVKNASGVVLDELHNYRFWVVDDDPPKLRVRLPVPFTDTTCTLTFVGYAPYKSELTSDADTCDLEEPREWIPILGAMSYLYRRRFHEFLDYERFTVENRANAVDAQAITFAYQDAEARFLRALQQHATTVAMPKSARLRR